MNISRIGNISFNGLLIISGPDKETDVIVNTDNIATISKRPFIGTKEDSILGMGHNLGAIITMNNGLVINTFLPVENVIESYKQAKANGEFKLETKFAPVITKPLIG